VANLPLLDRKPFIHTTTMTNETAITTVDTSVLADFAGGTTGEVEMMIGIGLVKDSDAVFFQYLGEEQTPQALVYNSGKPLTRFANVRLVGIDIAEEVGQFKSTKLNLYLESTQGRTIMLTSGLTTLWSQCVITSLMGLNPITQMFTLDSWKGKEGLRPCFAAIRAGRQKVSDQTMYDMLATARKKRDRDLTEKLMREAVASLKQAIGGDVEEATVEVTEPAKGDF
jgi:hypothetical protein